MSVKFKKTLFITAGALIALFIIVIAFISPIAKYAIEKYDEKFTGRRITLDWAYVNPFTGYIYLDDYTMYEAGSDSVFFSADGISLDVSLVKMLSGTYEISSFTLKRPFAKIIQNKQEFNFDDLLEKFASEEPAADTSKEPVHFNFLNITIGDGEFYYTESDIPVNYFIKNVNFESPGLRWDMDSVEGSYSFASGPGSGNIEGDFVFNLESSGFRVKTLISGFDLMIINEYLKDIANYGRIAATIDADIKASGSLNDPTDINAAGKLWINDFHFGKNDQEDYTSFDKLVMVIDDLSVKEKSFRCDSVLLYHPYFKYERYDSLDNVQTMFGIKGARYKEAKQDTGQFNLIVMIADYVKLLGGQLIHSNYKVNMFAIDNAEIHFSDYSLREKFSTGLMSLDILADSIDRERGRFQVSCEASIKPYGSASLFLAMNPKDYYDFDLSYRMREVPLAMFNPYMITYSSFPLDKGMMEFTGKWDVADGAITSDNHLIIIDPRVTKRVRKKDTRWLPAPLALAFIRERGNVIDYDVPIEGNLKDPSFRLKDVFLDLAKNIFIKPPTTPYALEVKKRELDIENFHALKWKTGSAVFDDNQKRFVKKIASFLKDNPEATISVQPLVYAEKEKEYILLFEAKKKFYLTLNPGAFSEIDSIQVDEMSSKDASFSRFLKKHTKDSLIFTTQERCQFILGNGIVKTRYHQLLNQREKEFKSYFDETSRSRITFLPAESTVPFNGFSFYKVSYRGDMPEKLKDAYEELNDLNEENFRKKYREKRKKSEELIYTEAGKIH